MAKLERSCGKGRQHAAGPGRTRLKRYPIGAEKGDGDKIVDTHIISFVI